MRKVYRSCANSARSGIFLSHCIIGHTFTCSKGILSTLMPFFAKVWKGSAHGTMARVPGSAGLLAILYSNARERRGCFHFCCEFYRPSTAFLRSADRAIWRFDSDEPSRAYYGRAVGVHCAPSAHI